MNRPFEKRKKAPKRPARITFAVTIAVTAFVVAILLATQGTPRIPVPGPTPVHNPSTTLFGQILLFPFHPEGKVIKHDLLLIDVQSRNIRHLGSYENEHRRPQFSPDRKYILYSTRSKNGMTVDRVDADGSNVVQLVVDEGGANWMNPSWSPDGTRIVYVASDGLYIANADGSNKVRLAMGFVRSDAPQWSPDGTRITFVKGEQDGHDYINVISADGSHMLRLINDGNSSDPQWSPDGTRIAFIYRNKSEGQLHLVNADGTDRVAIVGTGGNEYAQWSPDGTRLVYSADRNGKFDIYLFDLRTSVESRLTHSGGNSRYPVWSTNGKYVAFQRYIGSLIGPIKPNIVLINVDTLQELPEIEVNADADFAMQWVN